MTIPESEHKLFDSSKEQAGNPYLLTVSVGNPAGTALDQVAIEKLNQIAKSRYWVNVTILFFGVVVLALVIIGKGNVITDSIAISLGLPAIGMLYYWGVKLAHVTSTEDRGPDWGSGIRFCVPVLGIIPLVFLSMAGARILKSHGASPGLLCPKSFDNS